MDRLHQIITPCSISYKKQEGNIVSLSSVTLLRSNTSRELPNGRDKSALKVPMGFDTDTYTVQFWRKNEWTISTSEIDKLFWFWLQSTRHTTTSDMPSSLWPRPPLTPADSSPLCCGILYVAPLPTTHGMLIHVLWPQQPYNNISYNHCHWLYTLSEVRGQSKLYKLYYSFYTRLHMSVSRTERHHSRLR